MARDIIINGETLCLVKGASDTSIAVLSELGLADKGMRITPQFYHRDITVDAFGPEAPVDVQTFMKSVLIHMDLVHFDRDIFDVIVRLAMGDKPATNPVSIGQAGRAGIRLGNNAARFAPGYSFVGLNLTSPQLSKPWRFLHAHLVNPPFDFPLGTERSVVPLTWRAIPYSRDPYNEGAGGGQGNGLNNAAVIYDHTLDN